MASLAMALTRGRVVMASPPPRSTRLARVLAVVATALVAHSGAFLGHLPTVSRSSKVGVALTATAEVDERIKTWEKQQLVDEEALLAETKFAIAPAELVALAKTYLAYDQGVSKPELLADDFAFVGPVVGPLGKETYLKAVGGFHFSDAFPDANGQFHHFRVDPFDPGRVWFTARGKGTNTGEAPESPLFSKPTGKSYVNPPQACSLRFNAEGKVNQYTIGYVMDRQIGNTGGLGGIYGIAYAMGKPLPFPEAKPWKPSWQYKFFLKLGNFLQKLKDKKDAKKQ